ncbi:MAG: hypothetical protein LUF90_07200 [Rikenellaceae bacterium]|nr:hypothetical protein [Rikenellaceae bacterium]
MRIKRTIENILEDSTDFFKSMAGIIKVSLFSKYDNSELGNIIKQSDEMVILGNGPSLKTFIIENPDFLKDKELFCVNFSVESDYFETLRPGFYIATDPAVYEKDDFCDRLFGTLAHKTQWELNLFVPYCFRKSIRWKEHVKRNGHIRVYYINTTPVEGTFGICNFIFRNKLGMPRPQNVLIPALMVAVWTGFQKIYTAGVEHSWHNLIWVDDNNHLMIDDKHFYDNDNDTVRRHGSFDMSALFERLAKVFRGYKTIERFSRSQGAVIYNITKASFIDAFEKLTL